LKLMKLMNLFFERRRAAAAFMVTALGLVGVHVRTASAQMSCTPIFPSRSGWAIDMCAEPTVGSTMDVSVDGVNKGRATFVRVYQDTDDHTRQPNVMAVYSSSYVRLKQGADPNPAIPFGVSWILSEAYWPGATEYRANATLSSLAIATQNLPSSLYMRANGSNGNLASVYDLVLSEPSDARSTLAVTRRTTALANISIDPSRAKAAEGYKILGGASTMFQNETGSCPGGFTHCHDADRARVVAADGTVREVRFANVTRPGFMFVTAASLGGRWVDVRHTDATSWQRGDPPSIRACLDALPPGHSYQVQGYIAASDNVNDDNVGGPWVHDDTRAQTGWRSGETEVVKFRLIAANDFSATSPYPC